MAQNQSCVRERQRIDIKEPSKYYVIIHNDDVTTMDFVVMILREVFLYDNDSAVELMLQVHNSGKAIAGSYTYDIAHSKVKMATELAKANNFPLLLTVEQVK